jgi:hypothetical protein
MDPFTWVQIILFVISIAISIASRPKSQNNKPPALTDFSVPTAEEGREIQVLHGECWVDDPNVLWYGDLYTSPIKASGGK